jgi:ribonuclease HII
VEVSAGSVVAATVTLESTAVIGWRDSKEVLAISRRLSLDDDVLNDALAMQAVGHELQAHVSAELRRR